MKIRCEIGESRGPALRTVLKPVRPNTATRHLAGMAPALGRFWSHGVHGGKVAAARVVLLAMVFVSLAGTPAQAQEDGRAVRPDNQDNREAIDKLALTGRPCSLIGSLGLDENAEAVLGVFAEMERRREVRFDGDRAFFAGRAETMMLDMRDYEVAGILLATVVYRDCVSRRRSAPSLRLDAEAAGRLVFRQDAEGRITSFRLRTQWIRSARFHGRFSCAPTRSQSRGGNLRLGLPTSNATCPD